MMARAFLIVMDSVGCGGAPDAADFGEAFGGGQAGRIKRCSHTSIVGLQRADLRRDADKPIAPEHTHAVA